jgi:predicted nucleotide-binding protein
MYSLLVSHLAEEQSAGTFDLERPRFLEYTDDTIRIPLRGLSKEAVECLCSWPCLLMQEGRTKEIARVVEISGITTTTKDVIATIRGLPKPLEMTNDALQKLRTELDIEQFEFMRNHWAVKDRDLFAVLKKADLPVPAPLRERFTPKPLPVASRSELIAARDALAALGHAEIDDLLLEAGIAKLTAGRELGGRRARADAILRFALENPEAVTAENSLLSHFLLRRFLVHAKINDRSGAPITELPAGATEPGNRSPNRVFVVHGRNEAARNDVVAFLDSVGLEGIVLHEQASMGRHLLTKFIDNAKLVTFAVVLMTDDDVGSAKGGTPAPRARQNVVLELGYFLAYLGQAKVCALISPGLETPSDFDGIVYIKMAADQKWKKELFRELKAAKMPVVVS